MVRFDGTLCLAYKLLFEKSSENIFFRLLRHKNFWNRQDLEIIYPIDIVQKGLAQESNP